MKILKIFGLVVGVHAAAFMFVFAIPGCRATRRSSSPPPSVAAQADRDLAARPIGGPTENFQTPAAAASSSGMASPLGAPSRPANSSSVNPPSPGTQVSYSGSVPAVRFNPTRPGGQGSLTPTSSPTTTPGVPEQTSSTTHTVVAGDTLWKLAKQHHITTKELAAANNLRQDVALRPGQKLMVPGKATPISTGAAAATHPTNDNVTYKVRDGDSLALIARRAGTTTAAIKTLNKLKSDTVRVGQNLQIPAGPGTAALLSAAPENETASSAPRVPPAGTRHLVQPGENLGSIARRYGVSRRDLAVANNIVDPLKLRAGTEIVIPGASGTPARQNTPEPTTTVPESTPPVETGSPINSNPILPAGDGGSPIAPANSNPVPPVIDVQETNPIGTPKS